MFNKILIANRGEIAVRVIRTARAMGIRTVAVYSDADRDALHVEMADEACWIGEAAPSASYLRGERILQVAKATGAEAIHPGYGFLSENEDFARACAEQGVVFIGPPPSAIEAMGLKAESKRLMEAAGVPLVPGYHGEAQDLATLQQAAQQMGFPVLIKASAGGGGKGMKVAATDADFPAALESAKREARNAFGNDHVLIERYLMRPRHIEIQVFADSHGNCVYLFERDCSVQRRHQKVVEEAPAPGMTAEQREAMGKAAVAAAQAVGYVGAGTVEFIVEHDFAQTGRFYFMEMNTRLQVEHPVTEMITGLDLVEWQLRVASGQRLPKLQHELTINGHAFEVRIYAENPQQQFLPATGRITQLHVPAASATVRIDSGVRAGDEITPNYDPMVAKLITHGETRAQALQRMRLALSDYAVLGFPNNVAFLQRVFVQPEFIKGAVDTGFIAEHLSSLVPASHPPTFSVLAAAAVSEFMGVSHQTTDEVWHSPWMQRQGFWLNQPLSETHFTFSQSEQRYAVGVACLDQHRYRVATLDEVRTISVVRAGDTISVSMDDGAMQRYRVLQDGAARHVLVDETRFVLQLQDSYTPTHLDEERQGKLAAPMPGSVVTVNVKAGDTVTKGQTLLVMEAMKMEHAIIAPRDGVIEAVYYAERELVKEGAELVALRDPASV